jgi:hypothetical protein
MLVIGLYICKRKATGKKSYFHETGKLSIKKMTILMILTAMTNVFGQLVFASDSFSITGKKNPYTATSYETNGQCLIAMSYAMFTIAFF